MAANAAWASSPHMGKKQPQGLNRPTGYLNPVRNVLQEKQWSPKKWIWSLTTPTVLLPSHVSLQVTKTTQSSINAHQAPPLLFLSLFDSLKHTQTSCPIKSSRSRPPLSYYCGAALMLVKLAAMDDWEPPRPWSADIILPLKCNPALQQCLSVRTCVPAVQFVLVQM